MTFHNMFYLSFKEQLSYCIVKEMLLHSKSIAFESQKQCFYNIMLIEKYLIGITFILF